MSAPRRSTGFQRHCAFAWILASTAVLVLTLDGFTDLTAAARVGDTETECLGKTPTVLGTPGPDRITIDREFRHAVVDLRGGRDRVRVRTNHVRICGGTGNDHFRIYENGGGLIQIDAGSGDDEVTNEEDIDFGTSGGPLRVFAGSGRDRVYGSGWSDELFGEDGRDRLYGQALRDLLVGGRDNDTIDGGPYGDDLFGGPGEDELDGDWPPDWGYPSGEDTADGGQDFDRCAADIERRCEAELQADRSS